ncbi:MAG: glycosyltransferase family 4 protein [bacterium]|nr:glycosyltransferase family 4 protein [bacterium]MDZ4285024.1 glycosyltransferase family 4 protein [Patescibacteria group bacterium]
MLRARPKIFYVANARMPSEKAHGIQLAKMCEAFIEQGVDLTLVVPRVSGGGHGSVRAYYGLRVDVPTVFLPVLNFFPSASWGFTLRAFSFAVSSFLYVLLKRLRYGRAGAFIYTIDLDQFSYFLLPLAGFPVFFEAHGGKWSSAFLRFFLRRVRGVITNSGGTKAALLRDFDLAEARVVVEPNGIDLAQFAALPTREEARRALGLPQEAEIALYVGRFYGWKGLSILIEAARLLPNVAFWLVGGGIEEFCGVAGVSMSDVPANISFVGGVSQSEVPRWLAAADVLLVLGTQHNEYSWRETSPMKLFEYMASRRPIVASATPANREIVSDDEAIFYTPDDADSLARAITRALGEREISTALTDRAFAKVARWTWSERARRVLDFCLRS